MKTALVPHDIYMKHEIEWQALRVAAHTKIDFERIEIATSLGARWDLPTRQTLDSVSPTLRG